MDYSLSKIYRESIKDLVQVDSLDYTGTATAIFSSDVPEGVQRNIVGVKILPTSATAGFVRVNIKTESGGTEGLYDGIFMAKQTFYEEKSEDLLDPLFTLSGGQNLWGYGDTGMDGKIIIRYWDDELVSSE